MGKANVLDVNSSEWALVEILDVAQENDDVVAPVSYLSTRTQEKLRDLKEKDYIVFSYHNIYVAVTEKGMRLLDS